MNSSQIPDRLKSPMVAGIIIFLISFILYTGNGRGLFSIDTMGNRHLPVSLILHQSFNLDDFKYLYPDDTPDWGFTFVGPHLYNVYPFGVSLIATPIYAAMHGLGFKFSGFDLIFMEDCSAAIIMALTNTFFFLLLLRFTTLSKSILLTTAYGFGTINFVISSQALWQHTGVQSMLVGAMYCSFKTPPAKTKAFLCGLFLGMMFLCRPTASLILIPFMIWITYDLWNCKKNLFIIYLTSFLFLVFQIGFNIIIFRNIRGGYYEFVKSFDVLSQPFSPYIFISFLISPGCGLFIYSSFLLFIFLSLYIVFKKKYLIPFNEKWIYLMCAAALLSLLIYYSTYTCWYGGQWVVWGPRFLSDVFPLLCFMLIPFVNTFFNIKPLKIIFIILTGVSIMINLAGAYFFYPGYSKVVNFDSRHDQIIWSFKQSPVNFVLSGKHFFTPPQYNSFPVLKISQTLNFGNNQDYKALSPAGLLSPESWGTWSYLPYSRIYLKSAEIPSQIDIFLKPKKPATLKFYLNNKILYTEKVPDQTEIAPITIDVPPDLWKKDALNTLDISTSLKNPYNADTGDQRPLYIGFLHITLK